MIVLKDKKKKEKKSGRGNEILASNEVLKSNGIANEKVLQSKTKKAIDPKPIILPKPQDYALVCDYDITNETFYDSFGNEVIFSQNVEFSGNWNVWLIYFVNAKLQGSSLKLYVTSKIIKEEDVVALDGVTFKRIYVHIDYHSKYALSNGLNVKKYYDEINKARFKAGIEQDEMFAKRWKNRYNELNENEDEDNNFANEEQDDSFKEDNELVETI